MTSAVIAALLGGGLLAALAKLVTVWPELRKLRSESEARDEETEQRRFDDARQLRPALFACEDKCRSLEAESARLRQLLRRAPAALIEEHLDDLNGLRKLFDLLVDPVIVSTSEDSGKWIYINDAGCAKFQRSCDEIIEMGWRNLIHPDDLPDTSDVETRAWDEDVWDYVNRYVARDGSVVTCRWFCRKYAKRKDRYMTICVVKMTVRQEVRA